MIHILLLLILMISPENNFKAEQLKHERVQQAFKEKEASLEKLLTSKNLHVNSIQIYIQAFKHEGELEVWAKDKADKKFQLLKTYEICARSGILGPKRKEGDLQVPEGFYYINQFNPQSNYHLSLGINYPNASDKILSDKNHPGGLIYIHGNCVTVGCIPITDDKIKELYILAVEARNNGQAKIPVTIYPMKMTKEKTSRISGNYNEETRALWKELTTAFQLFDNSKMLHKVEFLPNGHHKIR